MFPHIEGDSASSTVPGVLGTNSAGGDGVSGSATTGGRGVVGVSDTHTGVEGYSTSGAGVYGSSPNGEGVHAQTNSVTMAALSAYSLNPSATAPAIWAQSQSSEAVHVGTNSVTMAAVSAYSINSSGTGPAIFGGSSGKGPAGLFQGNVDVTGTVSVGGDVVLTGADCAEEFDIAETADVEPGAVMILDDEGALRSCHRAYDKRVAGVIAGAGNYKPGIVLDRQHAAGNRKPIGLAGKVYCKVDAEYAPVEVGDLLTTSPTPGHAMKASDPFKAFGSVIGKALRRLDTGQDLIPILIALQ